jgi:hypothetical protein
MVASGSASSAGGSGMRTSDSSTQLPRRIGLAA